MRLDQDDARQAVAVALWRAGYPTRAGTRRLVARRAVADLEARRLCREVP